MLQSFWLFVRDISCFRLFKQGSPVAFVALSSDSSVFLAILRIPRIAELPRYWKEAQIWLKDPTKTGSMRNAFVRGSEDQPVKFQKKDDMIGAVKESTSARRKEVRRSSDNRELCPGQSCGAPSEKAISRHMPRHIIAIIVRPESLWLSLSI